MPRSEPWLDTQRLELWRPVPDDASAALQIMSDQQVVHHNPTDRVTSLDQAWAAVARWIAHWQRYDFGYTCVRRRGQREVIGFCGVVWTRRGEHPEMNLMYRFTPAVWGQGLATEAASAVLDWARRHHPAVTVLGRTRPQNLASQRVLIKAGLQRDPQRDDDGADGPDLLYSTAPLARS